MEKLKTNAKQPLPPIAYLVLTGAALGLSYAAVSRAIDTGSLLEYAVAFALFGLAVRNLMQFAEQKRGKGNGGKQ